MRITTLFVAGVVLLSCAIGVAVYPLMPDPVACHWNAAGEPDAYIPAVLGAFLLPVIIAAFAVFTLAGPKFGLRPLREKILFRDAGVSASLTVAILFCVYVWSIMQNLGISL